MFSPPRPGDVKSMCVHREDPKQVTKTVDKPDSRTRGHLGARPRGNPPLDRQDFARSVEKLARVLGR